jgi:methyl-accepting chemotaxis protein
MGNKSAKPAPPPDPCPGIRRYASDLSDSIDAKRRSIQDLTNKLKEKLSKLAQFTAANDELIKQIKALYTSEQIDHAVRTAMKPLEDTITKNNNEISNLIDEIIKINDEINDLKAKLVDERKTTDPIVSISNKAAQDFKFTETNTIINSNDKYYTYYTSIQKQNEKLADKVQNANTGDFTYDQKANFQYEKVSTFVGINYILLIAYFVFIIILVGLLFFVQKNMSIYLKMAIIALLIIYPFIIYTIEEFIYTWGSYTIALISGTVYVKTS